MADAAKIRITPRVRELLAEMIQTFDRFDTLTLELADPNTSQVDAVNLGRRRELRRSEILGLANQLQKEARLG